MSQATEIPISEIAQDVPVSPVAQSGRPGGRRRRRRQAMLRMLAAGIGLGALSRVAASPVEAANGDAVLAGRTVDETTPTRIRNGVSYTPDSTADGLQGYATDANNSGLFGRNNSTGGIGVGGAAPSGTGIFGESSNGYGVGGRSATGIGAYGESTGNHGCGGATSAAGYSGLFGFTGTTGATALLGVSSAPSGTAGYFHGAVTVDGGFAVTGSKSALVPQSDGSLRRLYCQESPEPWFEDFGQGTLVNGQASIRLDPELASLVRTDTYYVFLTELDGHRALYVTNRTATGFDVRSATNPTASGSFMYRVVARRKDIPGPRLERVTLPQFRTPDPTGLPVSQPTGS